MRLHEYLADGDDSAGAARNLAPAMASGPIRSGVLNREVCGCGLPLLLRCENDDRCERKQEKFSTDDVPAATGVAARNPLWQGCGDGSAQSQDRVVLSLFHPAVRQQGDRKCVPAVHPVGDCFGGFGYLRGSDRDPARVAVGEEDSILGSIPPPAENSDWGHDDRTGNVLGYERKQVGAGPGPMLSHNSSIWWPRGLKD